MSPVAQSPALSPVPTVTLHLWGVSSRSLPWVLAQLARPRRVARQPGLRFARLLGTGHGHSFTVRDADPRHWALLASWDTPAAAAAFEAGTFARSWQDHSYERWSVRLKPLRSTGRWSGRQPFGADTSEPREAPQATAVTGPIAVLTRARIATRQLATFARAVPPVARLLPSTPGLRFARGVGEAPLGLQATFSIWDDLAAVSDFAYRTAEHREVVRRTRDTGWYTEQLFARFAVVDADGLVDGRDPLAKESRSVGQTR